MPPQPQDNRRSTCHNAPIIGHLDSPSGDPIRCSQCGEICGQKDSIEERWEKDFDNLFVYTDFDDQNAVPIRREWRPTFQLPDREIAAIKLFIKSLQSETEERTLVLCTNFAYTNGYILDKEHFSKHLKLYASKSRYDKSESREIEGSPNGESGKQVGER